MYELIITDFSDIKSIVEFLKEINKLEILKENFGVIDFSTNINHLYQIYKKAEKYSIKLEIIKTNSFKLENPISIEKIEINENFLEINKTLKIEVKKIKALLLYFIKEPIIKNSPFIEINSLTDLIHFDVNIYLEIIYEEKRFLITPNTIFKSCLKFYELKYFSFKNILNLIDLTTKINEKVETNPLYQVFIKSPNYVKYFFKEVLNNKDVLWMIKTKRLNL